MARVVRLLARETVSSRNQKRKREAPPRCEGSRIALTRSAAARVKRAFSPSLRRRLARLTSAALASIINSACMRFATSSGQHVRWRQTTSRPSADFPLYSFFLPRHLLGSLSPDGQRFTIRLAVSSSLVKLRRPLQNGPIVEIDWSHKDPQIYGGVRILFALNNL